MIIILNGNYGLRFSSASTTGKPRRLDGERDGDCISEIKR